MPSLQDVRISRGWSRDELSRHTDGRVSSRTIARIEAGGKVLPSTKDVLCRALGTKDVDIEVSNRVVQRSKTRN